MSHNYPCTRTTGDVETIAGLSFPDPYRWLEDTSAEVQVWQKEQAELASTQVRAWPSFEKVRTLVEEYSAARSGLVPTYAAGLWFRADVAEGASQSRVLVCDEPYGQGRVLLDPAVIDPGKAPFLSWFVPSPDGRILAAGLCYDGSEQNTITLVDVDSGQLLPGAPTERLMDNWSGGVCWLPDSSGFYVTVITGEAIALEQQVLLHRRLPEPSTVAVSVPWTCERDYRMVQLSTDGRRLLAVERIMNPLPVAWAELDDPAAPVWHPFVTGLDAVVAGYLIGDRVIAVTDLDAPRGRLVSIALDNPTPSDPSTWVELVAESEAAVRGVTPIGDSLFLTEFVDTYSHVRIVGPDGSARGEVPLPGKGAVAELPFPYMNLARHGHPDQFLFGFSTLVASWATYRYVPGAPAAEELRAAEVALEGAAVQDCWATSGDGTRIPYHVVRPAGLDLAQPQATLLYAYGGFNAPWVPQFPGAQAAFVAAGGVFVHAHLRGGAEFGRDWWEGGRMKNKQNCYADLYAIAEQLMADGCTTSAQLAVTGGSNGGLMSGVAVTQRPDLWAAVIPRVPLLDVLGACRDPYGRMGVTLEFGDPDDPEEVLRLKEFSPYHLVEPGAYPAVWLDAGSTDPRCPSWHARKFGARLQAAQTGDAPILIRIWDEVGHGWATDKAVALEQNSEVLAFAMQHTGLTPVADPE